MLSRNRRVTAAELRALLVALCFLSPASVGAQPASHLELEAVLTVPVPAGFDVRGAGFLDDRTPVAWGSAGVLLLDPARNAPHRLDFETGVEPRGLRLVKDSETGFELLSPDGILVKMGHPKSRRLLPEGLQVVQAVPVSDGWFALATDAVEASGPPRLWFIPYGPEGEGAPVGSQPAYPVALPVDEYSTGPVRLSAGVTEVFITEISSPFHTWRAVWNPEGGENAVTVGALHGEELVVQEVKAFAIMERDCKGFVTARVYGAATALTLALRSERMVL